MENGKLGPVCKNCNQLSVERNAGFYSLKLFWYCTNCKTEVREELGFPLFPIGEVMSVDSGLGDFYSDYYYTFKPRRLTK